MWQMYASAGPNILHFVSATESGNIAELGKAAHSLRGVVSMLFDCSAADTTGTRFAALVVALTDIERKAKDTGDPAGQSAGMTRAKATLAELLAGFPAPDNFDDAAVEQYRESWGKLDKAAG